MMQKHTPLPWRIAEPGERVAFEEVHVTGANGRPVASTLYPLAKSFWRAEDEANACFIVTAVNAHEEMLAAAQFTLSVMKTNHLDIELSEKLAVEKLEAAIAKASPPGW